MGRALVLGAGQVGAAAARALLDDGWQVDILVGSDRPRDADLSHRATFVVGDRNAPESLDLALQGGMDLVVDTVAYDATHARQWIDRAGSIGAIVAISSASVYCDAQGRNLIEAEQRGFPDLPEPILETQTTVNPGPATYSTRKVALERALLEDARTAVTVLRPCAIHGVGSVHPREWWVVKRLREGRRVIPLAYAGASRFQTTAASAIGTMIAHVARQPGTRVLNVADGDAPSVREIATTIMASLGSAAELRLLAGAPVDAVGQTPWSVSRPFVLAHDAARAIGCAAAATYAETVQPMLRWLAGTPLDAFPIFQTYAEPPFDYEAEDRSLVPNRANGVGE